MAHGCYCGCAGTVRARKINGSGKLGLARRLKTQTDQRALDLEIRRALKVKEVGKSRSCVLFFKY